MLLYTPDKTDFIQLIVLMLNCFPSDKSLSNQHQWPMYSKKKKKKKLKDKAYVFQHLQSLFTRKLLSSLRGGLLLAAVNQANLIAHYNY